MIAPPLSDPDPSTTLLIRACVCFHVGRIFTCTRSVFSITTIYQHPLRHGRSMWCQSGGSAPGASAGRPRWRHPHRRARAHPRRQIAGAALSTSWQGHVILFQWLTYGHRKREFRNMLLHPSLSECKRDAHKSVSSWKQNTHISPVGWDICLAGAQSDEIELEYNRSCHLQVCLCCRQKPGWNLFFCNQVNVQLFCIKPVWSGMIWWIRCQPLLSEQGLRQHIFYFIAFRLFNGDISNLWSTQISNYFEIFSRSTDQLAFRSAAGGNMTFVCFFFDSPILFSSGNSLNLFHSCKMCMLECLRRAWGGSAKSI